MPTKRNPGHRKPSQPKGAPSRSAQARAAQAKATARGKASAGKASAGKAGADPGSKPARRPRGPTPSLRTVLMAGLVGVALILLLNPGKKAKPVPGGEAAYGPSHVPGVVAAATNVPLALAERIGRGSATDLPSRLKGAPLVSQGLPEVAYIGAEYCPFCATERWPMVIALSRFGTFTNLGLTHSSSTDADPNTPSFTFHGSSYASSYLVFRPVEEATNRKGRGLGGYQSLDTAPPAEQKLWEALSPNGGIPFVDLGGRYLLNGASYDPGVLQGKTPDQVAAALSNPASPIAQGAIGAANTIVAALCRLTNQQPAAVCTAPSITALQAKLG